MATQEQIESSYRFATEQIQKGADALSVSELFDLWVVYNESLDLHAENVAAIHASIDDMLRGETGRSATDVLRDARSELSLFANR